MLDMNTAKIVKKAIDEHFNTKKNGEIMSLEDVVRMTPVSKAGRGGAYTILSAQFGDMTILVWIQFNDTLGVCVRAVKTQAW